MSRHFVQVLLAALVVLAGVSLRQMSLAIDGSSPEDPGIGALGVAPLPPAPSHQTVSMKAGEVPQVLFLAPLRTRTMELKPVAVGTSPVPLPPPGSGTEERSPVAVGTSPVPLPPPGSLTKELRVVAVGTSPVPLPPPGSRCASLGVLLRLT